MGEHLPVYLQRGVSRLRGLRTGKNNHIGKITLLILGMGLFFYSYFDPVALANNARYSAQEPDGLIMTVKIGDVICVKNKSGTKKLMNVCKLEKTPQKEEKDGRTFLSEGSAREMVAGHPMEEMVPYISKREKKVASFLLAIAKKESDWGTYSPKKLGRECYNYWGYKGAYNLTESGYSCFDSPEQAIKTVGDKIEDLLSKQVNTAERMVVWKCGRSCAGHDPAGVRKWISDVALYYGKLNS